MQQKTVFFFSSKWYLTTCFNLISKKFVLFFFCSSKKLIQFWLFNNFIFSLPFLFFWLWNMQKINQFALEKGKKKLEKMEKFNFPLWKINKNFFPFVSQKNILFLARAECLWQIFGHHFSRSKNAVMEKKIEVWKFKQQTTQRQRIFSKILIDRQLQDLLVGNIWIFERFQSSSRREFNLLTHFPSFFGKFGCEQNWEQKREINPKIR